MEVQRALIGHYRCGDASVYLHSLAPRARICDERTSSAAGRKPAASADRTNNKRAQESLAISHAQLNNGGARGEMCASDKGRPSAVAFECATPPSEARRLPTTAQRVETTTGPGITM
ncbi:hypothetical protein MRX96_010503 [Rhipicephalus microplus]